MSAAPSAVPSPATSESNFTLLPGYVSRPGPSPLKQPAQQLVPALSQGGFLGPSHVEPRAQATGPPVIPGQSGGEDALWKELTEELKRVRELPSESLGATASVERNDGDGDRAPKTADKPRRTRRAAKAQQPTSKSEEAQATAEPSTSEPAQSRLMESPSKLTAGVRQCQPQLTVQTNVCQACVSLWDYSDQPRMLCRRMPSLGSCLSHLYWTNCIRSSWHSTASTPFCCRSTFRCAL